MPTSARKPPAPPPRERPKEPAEEGEDTEALTGTEAVHEALDAVEAWLGEARERLAEIEE